MNPSTVEALPERWASLSAGRRAKNRIIAAAARGTLELATSLPGRAAIGLGARLGRLAGRIATHERRRTERHLCAALGMREGSPEARRLSLAVFEHLGRSAGELAWAWRSAERVRELVRFGPGSLETMQRLTSGGRGVMFVTGHIGNWELLAWAVRLAGFPSSPVGRRSYDPGLTELMDSWRRRWGATTLWRESPRIADEILTALDGGVSVGILVDQAVDLPSVKVPFFGRPARTVVGPARLALAHRIPVVVGWMQRRADGVHVVDIVESPVQTDVRKWIASWSATLERAIRDEPAQWVWMHDRWSGGAVER